MPLTVFCKRLPDEQPGAEDDQGRRTYDDVYEVDQSDGGSAAAGVAVAIAAQAANSGPDIIPVRGDNWSYAGTTDLDSYILNFSWKRPRPNDDPRRWHIAVHSGPADGTHPGQLAEPNPLLWPTEYWVEWVEESIVIEQARNVDAMPHVFRPANTLGPIVTAAGCEPVDPKMKTRYYPILNCQKAYATIDEIIALNDTFQDTTNNGTYFGASARKAKYLITQNGRIQRTQGFSFYLGVTQILFKRLTWDLQILNNGWNCLVKKDFGAGVGTKYISLDDTPAAGDGNIFNGVPALFAMYVSGAKRISQPASEEDVLPSEPRNLELDGTRRITNDALKLTYRDLDEVDYSGIGIGTSG